MRHWPLRWFRRAARAGRAIDERFTPAGKWLLSVAGFAGVFSTDPERTHAWLLFTSTVSLLAVSLLASRLWRPRLSARRVLPPHVTALAEASYVIALRNEGGAGEQGITLLDRLRETWPSAALLAADASGDSADNWFDRRVGFRRWQRLCGRLQGATLPPLHLDGLAPGAEVRVTTAMTPLRRGWLEFDRLLVRKPDPLGLCYAVRELPLPDRVLSRPACVPIGHLVLPAGRSAVAAHAAGRTRGDGQEFFALRDYRPGDPLRHVDWRAFARRRLPVVRQFAAPAARPPLLLLDASPAPGREQDFETLLTVAASLLSAAALQPRASMALAIVRDQDLPAEMASGQDALDCLALLVPAAGDLSDSCAAALAWVAGERPVLFLTAHWDAHRAALVRSLGALPALVTLACDSHGELAESPWTLVLRDGARSLPTLADRLASLFPAAMDAR
jgi:uncharacterized protein (DUF58 family)